LSKFDIDVEGNVIDALRFFAEYRPDHPAVEDDRSGLSYAGLHRRSGEVAANLSAEGVRPGDLVGLLLGDVIEHVIILCALARLGAVMISLDPNDRRSKIRQNLAEAEAKFTIVGEETAPFAGFKNLQQDIVCRTQMRIYDGPRIAGAAPIFLSRSSGTTGKPKNCLLSHRDTLHRAKRSGRVNGWGDDERQLSVSSLSFAISRGSFFFMLQYGATFVLTRRHSLPGLVEFVANRRISFLKLPTSFVIELLEYSKGRKMLFPTVGAIAVTSAPITPAQRQMARQRLAPDFREHYGTNEGGMIAISFPADQDRHPDSVGRLLDELEAQVVNENGDVLDVGEIGLIGFRIPFMATAYLNNEAATAQAFRDEWWYPGDIAMIDENRYIFLKGRADDVINNAGIKIYPIEGERLLMSHPDVTDAAVFAMPHHIAGEVPAACFTADHQLPHAELRQFCNQRAASFRNPQYLMQVNAMPRNAMGKIDKRLLRRVFARQLSKQKDPNGK